MSSEEPKKHSGGGISIQTLLISSLAAVAAAIVVPMFWQKGSLPATAITPIIVAIVSAILNRPAEHIKTVAPRVTRRTATGAAVRNRTPSGVGARGDGPEQITPAPCGGGISPEDPFGLRGAQEPERGRGRPLKIALATGLLAFVIGAGVVTASELAVFRHAVGRSSSETGLFGGSTHHRATATPTPTATPSSSASPTPTASAGATPTPSATPTVTATATASPAPTASPQTVAPQPTATATP